MMSHADGKTGGPAGTNHTLLTSVELLLRLGTLRWLRRLLWLT